MSREGDSKFRRSSRERRNVKIDVIRYPFWFGGSASCFAACVTHPLDLIKAQGMANKPQVRLQTACMNSPSRGMVGMFVHVIKCDGARGLYSGLSASLLRQMTYSTTRFGVYEKLKQRFTTDKKSPSFLPLVGMSSVSGFLGGVVGNPADVLNVRMQNDAALPEPQRRNYRHAIDGLTRMLREEGWKSLFRGVLPNSTRALLMTSSQLATYDSIKRLILIETPLGDGTATHFTASFLAGFVATTICSPVDVIKTRIMSAKESESLLSLLTDIYRKEGVRWMFKGWVPSFIRLGPQTIATMMFLEQHKKIYRQLRSFA